MQVILRVSLSISIYTKIANVVFIVFCGNKRVRNILAMAPTIEKTGESLILGESPHWDVETQTLYLVDAFGKAIVRYDPQTKKIVKATLGKLYCYLHFGYNILIK